MNAKQAKKLRWMSRVDQAFMPPVAMVKNGSGHEHPSSILLYSHRKVIGKGESEKTFFNYTVQWHPGLSGRGLYRAMKRKLKEVGIRKTDLPKQSIVYTRLMCQLRIKRGLAQRRAAQVPAQ